MSTHRVFVYGILRQKEEPTHITQGRIFLVSSFPGSVFPVDPGSTTTPSGLVVDPENYVVGEVLTVDEETLHRFDAIEGYSPYWPADNCHYIRRTIQVRDLETLETESCWVYEYNRNVDESTEILEGDYNKRDTGNKILPQIAKKYVQLAAGKTP